MANNALNKRLADEKKSNVRPLDTELVNNVLEGKKQAPKQQYVRRFGLSSYIELTELDKFIRRLPWVQHWAYCHHDKDVDKDGQLKTPHTHIILYTYSAKTSSAIKKNFDNYAQELSRLKGGEMDKTLVEVCHDGVALYRYLTHKDNPEKYQYSDTDVVFDSIDYWGKLCYTDSMTDTASNKGLAMFEDIINGSTTLEMIERYGKEYIYHARNFKEVLSDYNRENYLSNINFKAQLPAFTEISQLVLTNSIFTPEQINIYFNLLSYVQSVVIDNYDQYKFIDEVRK